MPTPTDPIAVRDLSPNFESRPGFVEQLWTGLVEVLCLDPTPVCRVTWATVPTLVGREFRPPKSTLPALVEALGYGPAAPFQGVSAAVGILARTGQPHTLWCRLDPASNGYLWHPRGELPMPDGPDHRLPWWEIPTR